MFDESEFGRREAKSFAPCGAEESRAHSEVRREEDDLTEVPMFALKVYSEFYSGYNREPVELRCNIVMK